MDESLINKLAASKKFATEINQRLKDSKVTEEEINNARESYRTVAFRCSLLFFCITDLTSIDHMYQYSLQWFCQLFNMSVENTPAAPEHDERLKLLMSCFTLTLYQNVCRSLFEVHKLLFSLILTHKILDGYKEMDPVEWRYLLAGTQLEFPPVPNPVTWISENAWPDMYKQFAGVSELPAYKGAVEEFVANIELWKPIFDAQNAHELPMPEPWNSKLNEF